MGGMKEQILDVEPKEIKFVYDHWNISFPGPQFEQRRSYPYQKRIVELNKQITSSLQLNNLTPDIVAFKVKTTAPRKYCVRPNMGLVPSNGRRDFTVMMEAQTEAPPDMICKDKFLIQGFFPLPEATERNIKPDMFTSPSNKCVQEIKLRVVLVGSSTPLHSPDNSAPRSGSYLDPILNRFESFSYDMDFKAGDVDSKPLEDMPEPPTSHQESHKSSRKFDTQKREAMPKSTVDDHEHQAHVSNVNSLWGIESMVAKGVEDMGLADEIQKIKSKISTLETRINESGISKLTLEERLIEQEKNTQREIAELYQRLKRRGQVIGFPPLFVVMVALISLLLGYLMHH